MTKQELFEKYAVNEKYSHWDERDDRAISILIFRFMEQQPGTTSMKYNLDFLDGCIKSVPFMKRLITAYPSPQWEMLFLTAKRTVYKFADRILEEINNEKI